MTMNSGEHFAGALAALEDRNERINSMIGLRVVITDKSHPWHGFSGKITGMQALSPITREEGWRIELDNGMATLARGSALKAFGDERKLPNDVQ